MSKAITMFAMLIAATCIYAQAPEGPMTPAPQVKIQQPPPKKAIKLRSVLVNTPVTVRDVKGEMVHTLQQSDFHVTDNGVEQKITHFDLGGYPISLAVVMETSSRIEALLPELRKTGIVLAQAVTGPTGETAIIGFNDTVDKLLDFTPDSEKVEQTVAHLPEGTSGIKLYDAMAVAVEMLSKQPEVSEKELGHRRVMLVVAEAHDEGSEKKLGEVLREAQLQNITIYTVGLSNTRAMLQKKPEYKRPPSITSDGTFGLPPQPGTPQTPTTEEQRYGGYGNGADLLALAAWIVQHVKDKVTAHALEVSATATGGEHYATWKGPSIEKAMDDIGGELHSQYTLTYAPTGTSPDGYHEITVKVDRRDLKVRARPGYYLAPPES